ncbi:MAG: ATP-binding protein [Magnetococcales bacterium]|nr:ATP-binding protein [Nitrospirota bacterium]
MILKKIEYSEHGDTPHYWEIRDVEFGQLNLIVGLNATGKTLLLKAISKLASFMSPNLDLIRLIKDGRWKAQFYDKTEDFIVTYELEKSDDIVKTENITSNRAFSSIRNNGEVKISLDNNAEFVERLRWSSQSSLYSLRDPILYPIPEKLIDWAAGYQQYRFDDINQFREYYAKDKMENRSAPLIIPLLIKLLNNDVIKEKLTEDFNYIGYPIDDISIDQVKRLQFTENTVEVSVKEKGLECLTKYYAMSQGMFRALTLIVIIEDLLLSNSECTLVIDDIGEGLDFDRSSKLIKLIFSKLKDSNIQFIATTNNRFLINAVDIRDLNILEREGHVVKSYNYSNSKEQFDEFEFTGLGSFDLFRYQMYKTQEAQVE